MRWVLLALLLPTLAVAAPLGVRVAASGGLAGYGNHTVAPLLVSVTYALGPVELGLESSASVLSGSASHVVAACWGFVVARANRRFSGVDAFVQAGAGEGVLLRSVASDTVLAGRGGPAGRLELGLTVPSDAAFLELAAGVLSLGRVASRGVGDGEPDAARGNLRVQLLTFRLGAGVRF